MSSYTGWDEDVLRNIGKGDAGDLVTTPGSMVQPFTPINQTVASSRAVNPSRTLQNADLYDLPHSPITPAINPPTKSKRGAPASRRVQSKAATADSTETHTTNLQKDHELFEVSSPKRRKTPMKRAQSMKAFKMPSKIQTPTGQSKKQAYSDERSTPQLVTPPDTNKKLNKRAISVMQNSTKSPEFFQSSNVSNAAAAKGKPGRDVPRSINSLQGFITTEDQLKFNSNGIANTTLQKLAAFRYKAVEENSTSDVQESESNAPHIYAGLEQDQALRSLGEVDNTSLDYGHIPINDSFFNEALWTDDNQHHSVEAALCVEDSSSAVISEEPMNYTSLNADGTWYDSEQGAQMPQQGIPPLEPQAVENSRSLLGQQMTHGKMDVMSQQFSAVDIVNKTSAVEPLENPEDFSSVGTPAAYLSTSPRHIVNSDTRHSLATNHLADENLDDNLPDEDLLAFLDDTRVPASSAVSPGTGPVKFPEVAVCTREAPHLQHSPTGQQRDSAASLPVETDEEDEYPMDEDFENAISKLPAFHTGVIETFHPSPSIDIPADDTCTDKEVYDNSLQFSSPRSLVSEPEGMARAVSANISSRSVSRVLEVPATSEEADWSYVMTKTLALANTIGCQSTAGLTQELILPTPSEPPPVESANTNKVPSFIDDSHEYLPVPPFARPPFPMLVRDRCPVDGLTAKTFLRVCFRIGEMLKEGGRCDALGQEAIIELFARVTFSSREFGTTKQHFQFADIFHDRPPFAKGILAHFNPTRLVDAESRVFLESGQPMMARCLGTLKKDLKSGGWLLHIINIRVTDWEEIRWTKRIVSADHDEKVKLARLRAEA